MASLVNGGSPARLVLGTVTRHEPYGFYVNFRNAEGGMEEGLVVITMVHDNNAPNPDFPPIGSQVEAVLLGYTDVGGQPRLSIRPQDVASAAGGGSVAGI